MAPKAERRNRKAESVEVSLDTQAANAVPGPQSAPQLLEWDRVVSYLDEHRFLVSQAPSAMSDLDSLASLKRRYDEAWFYARLRRSDGRLGSLTDHLEREAHELASESWPISFVLALHYARAGDTSRADTLANQFATLLDQESDVDRLAYYRGDVHMLTGKIAPMCEPETANRLASILSERLPQESPGGVAGIHD